MHLTVYIKFQCIQLQSQTLTPVNIVIEPGISNYMYMYTVLVYMYMHVYCTCIYMYMYTVLVYAHVIEKHSHNTNCIYYVTVPWAVQ